MYNNLKLFDRSWLRSFVHNQFPDANCKRFYNGNVYESDPDAKYSIIFFSELAAVNSTHYDESNIFYVNYFVFNCETTFDDFCAYTEKQTNFLSDHYYNYDLEHLTFENFKNSYESLAGSSWPTFDDYVKRAAEQNILNEIDVFYEQQKQHFLTSKHKQLFSSYQTAKNQFEKTKKLIDTVDPTRDIFIFESKVFYDFFVKNGYKCILLDVCQATLSDCINLNLVDYKKHFRKAASKEKNYFCLNRVPKKERLQLIKLLNDNNLTAHGYVTDNAELLGYNPKIKYPGVLYKNNLSHYVKTHEYGFQDMHHTIDDVPCGSNFKNFKFIADNVPGIIKIIVETDFGDYQPNGVTEKAVIGFITGRIPIIAGNYKIIDFFRQQGFDMFDDIVDHSYDNVIDNQTRISELVTKNKSVLQSGVEYENTIVDRLNYNQDYIANGWIKKMTDKLVDNIKNLK